MGWSCSGSVWLRQNNQHAAPHPPTPPAKDLEYAFGFGLFFSFSEAKERKKEQWETSCESSSDCAVSVPLSWEFYRRRINPGPAMAARWMWHQMLFRGLVWQFLHKSLPCLEWAHTRGARRRLLSGWSLPEGLTASLGSPPPPPRVVSPLQLITSSGGGRVQTWLLTVNTLLYTSVNWGLGPLKPSSVKAAGLGSG